MTAAKWGTADEPWRCRNHPVTLVAKQPCSPLGIGSCDGIRRHVHQIGLHSDRMGHDPENLVPRQPLVGGDVEGVADSGMSEQANEGFREVALTSQARRDVRHQGWSRAPGRRTLGWRHCCGCRYR